MVGPFVFFDHMGPARMPAGQGLDVRPHPHIGLATITWLFEGAILHRDSLGCVQRIEPGDVNRPIRRSRRRVGLLSWFCKQTTAGQWMRNLRPIV